MVLGTKVDWKASIQARIDMYTIRTIVYLVETTDKLSWKPINVNIVVTVKGWGSIVYSATVELNCLYCHSNK